MSAEKHPYRTGIITSIVAAIIWSFIPGWSWTFHAIGSAFAVFTWRIPLWLIILFIGSAAILIIIRRRLSKDGLGAFPDEETPEFFDYTEDRFYGVIWRWSYNGINNPVDPVSFCPSCDMQLVVHESHGPYLAAGIVVTYLFCERCEVEKAETEGKYRQLVGRIIREVERKIRSGEYRTFLTP